MVDLSEMSPPLMVEGLVKRFGDRRVVNSVSLHVRPGEITGLLGPNGSGKSTTLHCMTGLYHPSAGTIRFAGIPSELPAAKEEFGFFPDDIPYPASLTARETIAFHRRLRPVFDDRFVLRLVDVLGLGEHLDKQVGDYSHGMRRKLQLVLALAHHPRCLLLDEPLRGLDPEAAELMNAVLDQFRAEGGGVLLATHDLHAAERFCDEVVILSEGAVVAQGAPAAIVARTGTSSLPEAFVALTGLRDRVQRARHDIEALFDEFVHDTTNDEEWVPCAS